MCGGSAHIILLLLLMARCIETIDVCIWRMFVVVTVLGYVLCRKICLYRVLQ